LQKKAIVARAEWVSNVLQARAPAPDEGERPAVYKAHNPSNPVRVTTAGAEKAIFARAERISIVLQARALAPDEEAGPAVYRVCKPSELRPHSND
jgi:hypothetical protein